MIPNEIIDQILDRTDIVEVVSGYVPLKKSGQNFKARCPFHDEKTPSFMVSPAKQIYHCFGCGAGGNAIGFLMKYENMDFIESIKMLADKANIPLPRPSTSDKTKLSFAEKLCDVNNLACNLYQENLTKEFGKDSYKYFIQRGLNERTIKHFRLGFAQDSWQGLIDYCKTKGLGLDLLEKAGLILKSTDTENWYDRFRNRIIFPIFDLRNKVLGFGARAIDETMPKYINSPETYIYTKGKHLYGLNFAKQYIRKQNYVIIVEGYFDLILPFQNDIRNIVATLGTALTPAQVDSLRRFTKNVIMIYDSDKAGEEATLRGLELLIEKDMNVRIAILPKGTDPDSFVRKEERQGFMKILKGSKDFFDYKLGTLTARFRKNEPRGKARIIAEMLPTLAKITNAVLKSSYLKRISEELSVDEESVRMELKKVRLDTPRTYPTHVDGESKKGGKIAEITLLAISLEDTGCAEKIENELSLKNFKDESIASILEKIRDLNKNGKKVNPSHLISYFEDNKTEEIISEAVNIAQTIQDKNRVLNDCIKHLRKDNLKEALSNIQFKIREAESASDLDRVRKLITEYNERIKELRN